MSDSEALHDRPSLTKEAVQIRADPLGKATRAEFAMLPNLFRKQSEVRRIMIIHYWREEHAKQSHIAHTQVLREATTFNHAKLTAPRPQGPPRSRPTVAAAHCRGPLIIATIVTVPRGRKPSQKQKKSEKLFGKKYVSTSRNERNRDGPSCLALAALAHGVYCSSRTKTTVTRCGSRRSIARIRTATGFSSSTRPSNGSLASPRGLGDL
jgi:hypothetical protein